MLEELAAIDVQRIRRVVLTSFSGCGRKSVPKRKGMLAQSAPMG